MSDVSWRAGLRLIPLDGRRVAVLAVLTVLAGAAVRPVQAQTPPLLITEFMAANGNTLNDEDGDSSDWIEIYNAGTNAVSLDGWYLTDATNNLRKWRFPNVALSTNSYLIVFASSKNRTNALAPLHSNFGLNDSGEYLGLVQPDGTNVVSEFAPRFPRQFTDVSYGRVRDMPDTLGYFVTPTPRGPNSVSGAGFAGEVEFSRGGGTFVTPFTLQLRVDPPATNAVIRYTLNGTTPASNSTVYTGPIPISTTTQVRARAFQPGLLPGPTHSEAYLQLTTETAGFSSDLPVVVIHTFGNGIPGSGDAFAYLTVHEPIGGRTLLTDPPMLASRAGINARGSSTQGYPKQSFAVEWWDEFNLDTDHEVLGLPAESDFVLYAPNFFDKGLIHNPLLYQISRDVGRYGSRTRFVEVYLATVAGVVGTNNYWGIYVLEEKVKRDNARVDIAKLEPENITPPTVTGGYLLKIDRQDADERVFTTATSGQTIVYQDPDGVDLELPQRDPQEQYIRNYFNAFEVALNGANWTNPATGYPAFIDIDSWIDHHVLNVLALSADAFRLSGYFFKDRNKKLEMGPVWDFDRALGTGSTDHNDWRAFNPRSWMSSNPLGSATSTDYGTDYFNNGAVFANPWYRRLFTDPDFWQKWIDRWQELRQGPLATNALLALTDRLAGELREAQPRDLVRWGGRAESSVTPRAGLVAVPAGWPDRAYSHTFPTPGTFQGEVDFQKRWFADRVNFIDTNLLDAPLFNTAPGLVSTGATLILMPATKPGSRIIYTLDGTDPRLPGGAILPSAFSNVGPVSLTLTQNVRVFARSWNPDHRNLTGARNPPLSSPWSGPAAGTFYVGALPLIVTELMYHPADPPAGNTNDADNFEFIELKNVGTDAVDLNGVHFTAGVEFTFTGSAVTNLAPNERVLVVAHRTAFLTRYPGATNVAGTYVGNLDNNGEHVRLEGPAGEPILDFIYDDDWYPITDGLGFSLVLVDEGTTNAALSLKESWRPSGVVDGSPGSDKPSTLVFPPILINELLTHTDVPQIDAIELINPTDADVDLGGWFLSDDQNAPKKFRIPDGRTVPRGGFIVFDERDFNATPGTGTSFSFSSKGDQAFLFSGDGTNLTGYFDGEDFGAAANGVSFGRYTNSVGEVHFVAQAALTLGQPNAGPLVSPVVIREIMYHPRDGMRGTNVIDNSEDEYIELFNRTAVAQPLFNGIFPWRIENGVEFNLPPNVTLPPGGSIVIANFDPGWDATQVAEFRERFGLATATPVFGPFEGKLDNSADSLELKRPDTPEQNEVPYVLVDKVNYTELPPWPNADGNGSALRRIDVAAYGNDPANWSAVPVSRPTILTQPVSTNVPPGASATLSVVASGMGLLRYQWFFEGSPLGSATSSTLMLTNLQLPQSGIYTVTVTDDVGTTTSRPTPLYVLVRPTLTVQPMSQTVVEGSTVTFTVAATGTTPISFRWRRNGVTFTNGIIVSTPTNSSLLLENVSATNNGAGFTVVATNIAGQASVSSVATLTVLSLPQITVAPTNRVVPSGSNVLFSVTATGGGLRYLWFRNGQTFLADTATGTYTVTNAQSGDEGAYSVIASNLAGLATSPPATLQVEYRPVLESPGMKTVNELTLLTFTVMADADLPTDGLAFTLDGAPPLGASISTGGEFRWLPSERQGPGDYSFTVRATDQGTLRLSGTTTFPVRVNEVNAPPEFVDTRMKYVRAGTLLSFPTAADRDFPSNHVTVTLAPNAPAGIAIDPATGQFSWTPTDAQAPGDYAVSVSAADDGTPPLEAHFTYSIRVKPANEVLVVANVTWTAGLVRLHWASTPGKTYQVEATETPGEGGWTAAGPPLVADGPTASVEFPAAGSKFFRIVQLD